jgi:outer membrane lipoprotein-sorting protein
MKYLILITAIAFLTIAWPNAVSASQEEDIRKAENYLNNLETARSRFTQIAPDGSRRTGTFYLNKPGKLRFEYDPPTQDFIVADGTFIYFYDAELNEQTHAPIGQTLADFILRENLNIGEDVIVTDITRGGGLLQITLVQKEDPKAGSLKLGFQESPVFSLKKWRVTDAQGSIVEIMLADIQTNARPANELFIYRNPNPDPMQYNQ